MRRSPGHIDRVAPASPRRRKSCLGLRTIATSLLRHRCAVSLGPHAIVAPPAYFYPAGAPISEGRSSWRDRSHSCYLHCSCKREVDQLEPRQLWRHRPPHQNNRRCACPFEAIACLRGSEFLKRLPPPALYTMLARMRDQTYCTNPIAETSPPHKARRCACPLEVGACL